MNCECDWTIRHHPPRSASETRSLIQVVFSTDVNCPDGNGVAGAGHAKTPRNSNYPEKSRILRPMVGCHCRQCLLSSAFHQLIYATRDFPNTRRVNMSRGFPKCTFVPSPAKMVFSTTHQLAASHASPHAYPRLPQSSAKHRPRASIGGLPAAADSSFSSLQSISLTALGHGSQTQHQQRLILLLLPRYHPLSQSSRNTTRHVPLGSRWPSADRKPHSNTSALGGQPCPSPSFSPLLPM